MSRDNSVYTPDRIMSYSLGIAMIETLAAECMLSEHEKRRLFDMLRRRYGLEKTSIFAK